MTAQDLLTEPIRWRKSVGDSSIAVDRTYKEREKSAGDSSGAVDRIYKGRAKSVGDSSGAVDRNICRLQLNSR